MSAPSSDTGASLDLKPNVIFKTKSIEAVRSLVAQNLGVTILSDLVYRPWPYDGGRVQRTRIVEPIPSMDIGLAIRQDAPLSAAVMALLQTLRSLSNRLDPSTDIHMKTGSLAGSQHIRPTA